MCREVIKRVGYHLYIGVCEKAFSVSRSSDEFCESVTQL